MTRRLTIPAILGVTLVACSPTPSADTTTSDATNDTAAESAVTCADPNMLPTEGNLGCWTCDPPEAGTYTNFVNPSESCGLCSNPMATIQPRGGCGRCAPPDGGAAYVYC